MAPTAAPTSPAPTISLAPTTTPDRDEFVLQSSLRVDGSVVFDLDSGIIFGPRDQISVFVSESESGLQFNAGVSIDDEEEGNILGLSSILKYDGSRIYDVDSGMSLGPDIEVEVFLDEVESGYHLDMDLAIDVDGDYPSFNTALNSFGPYDVDQT